MGHLLAIRGERDREAARAWVSRIPDPDPQTGGAWHLEVHEPKRTDAQNRLLWLWLNQLARQLPWHGAKLSAEDYKDLLTASLRSHLRTVMNVEGTGFVVLGMRTSKMNKRTFTDLLDLIQAFAAQNGVELTARREDYA